jgi:hypothetical protein
MPRMNSKSKLMRRGVELFTATDRIHAAPSLSMSLQ